MKYTKTAAALALAGAAATPLAQAADTTVTLSGQVAIGILASDAEDEDAINVGDILQDELGNDVLATADDVRDAASPGEATIFGDDATINVNATGVLNNGLTGYANYRTDLGLVGDSASGDNIHVGIRGDFGDIRVGEVPDATGFGQLANDAIADIDGENFGISYTGSFSGLTIGVNASPAGSSDRYAAGAKFNFAGFGVGVGFGSEDDNSEFSVGATYAIAGISIAAGFQDFGEVGDDEIEQQTISLKAGYNWNDLGLGITFESQLGDFNEDDTLVRFDVGYDLGTGTNISARLNVFTDDSDDDGDLVDYRLLLTKAF